METKYYTPEISEFFVGFEYEWYYHPIRYKLRDDKISTWEKRIYKGDDFIGLHKELGGEWIRDVFQQIKDIIKPRDLIRVKYLDVEDIKSLEFIFEDSFDEGKTNWFKRGEEIKLLYYPSGLGNEGNITIYEYAQIKFNGNIKNKSEFKKLLQQLDIK